MRRPPKSFERGATLVIVAFSMTLLLLIAALVIDLGFTRSDRRGGQLAVDSATTAAGQVLADTAGDGAAACNAAFDYLEVTLGVTFDRSGCSTFSDPCVDGTGRTLGPVSSGAYTVVIEHPVLQSSALLERTSTIGAEEITFDASFDGSDCERFGLSLTTAGSSFFGSIAGQDGRRSTAHAVVRGEKGIDPFDIPAFLMLERFDCGVLVDNNSNNGISVLATTDGTQPGIIHIDSDGTGDCGGSDKDYAVFGTALPSAGGPSIRVASSSTSPPESGEINVVADDPRDGGIFPGGLNVDTTPRAPVISRLPVDIKYNSSTSPAISTLHETAYIALTSPVPADYTTVGCAAAVPVGVTKIFVDCPSGYDGSATFDDVEEVVFSHDINLKNSSVNTFTDARRVVVRGSMDVNNGDAWFPQVEELYVGGGFSSGNDGRFSVNSATELDCASPGADLARFVVFGGDPALRLGDSTAFCNTTVYLAGPLTATNASYDARQDDTRKTSSSCTASLPCPEVDADNTAIGARFETLRGVVTWTAPSQYDGPLPVGVPQGLEDLAFWSEGGGVADVKSGSEIDVEGVMFGPNLRIEMRSPAAADPRSAQFIARKLWLNQGRLLMEPARGNLVEIPSIDNFRLIR